MGFDAFSQGIEFKENDLQVRFSSVSEYEVKSYFNPTWCDDTKLA